MKRAADERTLTSESEAGVPEDLGDRRRSLLAEFRMSLIGLGNSMFTWAFWKPLMWALVCIVISVIIGAVIMMYSGYEPLTAYYWLMYGALTQPDRVIFYGTPLILTSLSVALSFKCGLFNIGPEGQLYMGSMAAALVGYLVALPVIIHPIVCLAVGAIVGGLWAFLPGLLKAYRGAHEVVTTMMLSYVAILFTSWLSSGPFKEPGWVSKTPLILPTAILPHLFGPYMHAGFFVALLAVIGVYVLFKRTVLGYEMRAVGFNRDAAETAGINPRKNMALALGLSGGLAGLSGAGEILGYHYRFVANWSAGYGWDGITAAVLGRNNPWGCLLAAIFLGALRAGGNSMSIMAQVPAEMIGVVQGLIVLFVAAPRLIDWLAKSGVSYAVWLRKKPTSAIPWFAAVTYGVAGAFLAIGYSVVSIFPLSLMFLLTSVAGLLAFSMTFSRYRTSYAGHLFFASCWLVAGIMGLMYTQTVALALPSLVMCAIGIVIWFLVVRLAPKGAGIRGCQP